VSLRRGEQGVSKGGEQCVSKGVGRQGNSEWVGGEERRLLGGRYVRGSSGGRGVRCVGCFGREE
jgi:hypothetical protein